MLLTSKKRVVIWLTLKKKYWSTTLWNESKCWDSVWDMYTFCLVTSFKETHGYTKFEGVWKLSKCYSLFENKSKLS